MKRFIVLIFIFMSIMSCAKKNDDMNPIKVNIDILGKNTEVITHDGDTITTYPFRTTIINQKEHAFGFWIMASSFWENLIFNSNDIKIYPEIYDRNFAKLIRLSPKEKYTFEGEIVIKNLKALKQQNDLKLGFILVRETEYSEFTDESTFSLRHVILIKKNRNDIIWCDKSINYDW